MLLRSFSILVALIGLGLLALASWAAWVRAGLAFNPPGTAGIFGSSIFYSALAVATLVSAIQLFRRRRWSLVAIAFLALLMLVMDGYLTWAKWAHHGTELRDIGGFLLPLFILLSSIGFYWKWPHAQRH